MSNFLKTNQFPVVFQPVVLVVAFLVAYSLVVALQQFRVVEKVLLLLPDPQESVFLNLNSPLRYHVQTFSTSYLAGLGNS